MHPITIIIVLLVWNRKSLSNKITVSKYPPNSAELCRKYGYPAEKHIVTTQDDYELQIFRIPFGIENTQKINRAPLLFLHGIESNSNLFVLRGPNDLAFQLVEDGFDVWLGNFRGSRFASNVRYSKEDNRYWNFSSDDIAKYDLSAMIVTILNETGQNDLTIVSYSRGGCHAAMLLTDQPVYNRLVDAVFMVAPTIYDVGLNVRTRGVKGPKSYNSTELYKYYIRMNIVKAIEPSSVIEKVATKILCETADDIRLLCKRMLLKDFGIDVANFNESLFTELVDYIGDGLSAKELIQYLQHQESGEFKKFDGRPFDEFKTDNQEPTFYDLGKLTSPLFIYYGPNDQRVSRQNLERVCSEAKSCRKLFQVPDVKFDHIDYFVGLNTNKVFIPVIRQDINNFLKNEN